MADTKDYLLSVATSPEGDIVYIHANKAGLEQLSQVVERLKAKLEKGDCDHDHLFTEEWGGHELTASMLNAEQKENCKQVHHIKIYSWTSEWEKKHEL